MQRRGKKGGDEAQGHRYICSFFRVWIFGKLLVSKFIHA